MRKLTAGIAAVAVALALDAGVAAAKRAPDTTLQDVGAALQAHGIAACETDWPTLSLKQDGTGRISGHKEFPEEHDRRERIVVLAPQPCPPLDETGDVSSADNDKVGLIGVIEFKSRTAGASLKKHGQDYTRARGIGYVYQGTTLITLDVLEPPGMASAFAGAMGDLHAHRRYVSDAWRQLHKEGSGK